MEIIQDICSHSLDKSVVGLRPTVIIAINLQLHANEPSKALIEDIIVSFGCE